MQAPDHPLSELFAQLGLPADPASLSAFICRHAPLDPACPLEDAPFWHPAQRDFLRRARSEDADWTTVVDLLDAELRHPA